MESPCWSGTVIIWIGIGDVEVVSMSMTNELGRDSIGESVNCVVYEWDDTD